MSVEIVLAIVLVSVFVTNGIITLIALQSSWHWFLKSAFVLACLSPLLLVPALEPFVTLVLQSATIAAGVTLYRLKRSWRERKESSPALSRRAGIRFSLSTVLLIAGLAGIFLGVGIRVPELNKEAWLSIFVMGICSGACVLLAWTTSEGSAPWYVRWPLMLVGATVFAAPLVWFDVFVASIITDTGWPPDIEALSLLSLEVRQYVFWCAVCLLILVFVAVWLWASRATQGTHERAGNVRQRTMQVTSVGLRLAVLSVCLPALAVLWKLLTPLPIPDEEVPQPNGYAVLNELGEAVEKSPFGQLGSDWSVANEKQLERAVSSTRLELKRLLRTLTLPYHVVLKYTPNDNPVSHLTGQRALAYALAGHGRLAIMHGRPDEGCRYFLATVRLGYVVRSGGLVINALVGQGVSGVGISGLYAYRQHFSRRACAEAGREILAILNSSEPFETTLHRERVWGQHAFGWHGHLGQILSEFAGQPPLPLLNSKRAMLQDQAMTRLIALELALQAYHADEGRWPINLSDLVPAYLPYVPRDPFDDSRGPLRYAERNDGYAVYSVGENGTDERGLVTRPWESGGDLTLEKYFTSAADAIQKTSKTDSVME